MRPQPGEALELLDAQQRHLGWMALEENGEGLLQGTFTPGPDYPAVQPLFRAFEEAVDLQALSAVDRLDATMAALGLWLRTQDGALQLPVHDVQIWSDRGMSCRVSAPARVLLNGSPPTNQATSSGEDKDGGNVSSGRGAQGRRES